jgi:hypothetical protein
MKTLPLFTLTLLIHFPTLIASWGNLGHRTIAFLAEKYLTPPGHSYVQRLLKDQDISDAAIWADSYKYTPPGLHTSSWHFINAHDDPPSSCGLRLERDCSGKNLCIITAISAMVSVFPSHSFLSFPFPFITRLRLNVQTERLMTPKIAPSSQTEAFKFLLHLIGDLHNPLHVEDLSKGGNGITVLFENRRTNLHFLWDFGMLLKHTQSTEANEIEAAKELAEKLFVDAIGRDRRVEDCLEMGILQIEDLILAWANETNHWVCDYVLKDGVEAIEGKELSGNYYQGAIPIIEELIGIAGWRLAGSINALAKCEEVMGFGELGREEL